MNPEHKFFVRRPKEEETLIRKREEKLRRLNHLRTRWEDLAPKWWIKVGEELALVGIFFINFSLIRPFFGQEDKLNVFSAPVMPLLTSLTEPFLPFSYGVRIWLLIFLILMPISLYFFVREISGRKLTALLASLIVSLPVGTFLPARLNLGVLGEDGSHIACLTFIPFVCLLLLKFLRHGQFKMAIFSALGTALVALTSPIGFLVLGTFMVMMTFSEMLLGGGRIKLSRFLTVVFLAIGFSAFWYNPKFVILTLNSSAGVLIKKTFWTLLPVSFFTLPLLGIFGFLLFENRPQLQPVFIAFFLTVAFGLFSLGAGISHPSPSRFLPAFGMSLAFFLGILAVGLADIIRFSDQVAQRLRYLPFKKELASTVLLIFIFVLVFTLILQNGFQLGEVGTNQVLGAFAAEKKVGIWEIREQTNTFESIFGYGITFFTVLTLIGLRKKLKI